MRNKEALHHIRNWLHGFGESPTDRQFEQAIHVTINTWVDERSRGMDVLASATLDELSEIVYAMRKLL